MKTKRLITTGLLVLMPAFCFAKVQTVMPEVTTPITLSSTDVNRISCTTKIQDVVFSEEKDITANFIGNDAYVKFKVKKRGTEFIYAAEPAELFIVCGGRVYTMIASPERCSSKTVRLSAGQRDQVSNNVSAFAGIPYEKQVLKLLKQAYQGSFSSSYQIKEMQKDVPFSKDLKIKKTKKVEVPGTGFNMNIFEVKATPPRQDQEIELFESDFMNSKFGSDIAAIAIESPVLAAFETTRVFVVDGRGGKK